MSTPKEIMRSPAYRYAEDALGGKIMAPITIKQQAGHFLDELKLAEKGWKYTFDLDKGLLPVRFCEQFLIPSAGEYASFKFLPWQEFVDCQAFGWVNRETGYRRYREVFEMVPRGNGKTARNSGKMGHMSTKGTDFGAENYFCGCNGKQAKRFYMDFYRQMRHSPVLKKRLHLTRAYAEYEPQSVVIEALGNDADVLDGLRPYYVVKDELEGERDFAQINQLLRPMKKRRQPMMWYTGTAGTVLDGPMVYHYNYAKQILARDPDIDERAIERYLPIIYEIDPDLPYEEPDNWAMCNPSLGSLLLMEDLLDDWARSQRSPAELADFVTKQLNRFATPPEAVYVDLETIRRNDRADMQTSLCRPEAYAGFDLSKSEDFTAAAIVFELPGGYIGIEQHSWVPEDKLRRGNGREEKDWHEWVRRGYMTIVPGRYVKYDLVYDWLMEQRHRYDIRAVGYDPYNAPELVRRLRDHFDMREVIQGPRTLNAPMKTLKTLLLDGMVMWGHDEMFEWYLRNVRMRADFFDLEKENWMPTKKNRYLKIDGFMAALDAFALRVHSDDVPASYWEGSHVIGGRL